MPLDIWTTVTELLPALNAAVSADLYFWTPAELYAWADEAVKHLARTAQVFVSTLSVTGANATIPLGTNAVAAIRAYWNGVAIREASVSELEALDDNWQTATGVPARWTQGLGLGSIRLYPAPAASGTVLAYVTAAPADLSTTATTIEAVLPFDGFLLQAMLGRARGKVSDAQMPEIAAHCAQRVALYEQVFAAYWGGAG